MPRYRDTFKLDLQDLELIEHALRAHAASGGTDRDRAPCPRAIQDLLGRLHAQKIFYSHTRTGGIPNG
jgi:hypothetical protein